MPHHVLSKVHWVLGLVAALLSAIARAEDVPPPGSPAEQSVAFDSTFDINSFGAGSLDLNTLFAPGGHLNESGFRARLTASTSWYRFVATEAPRMLASGRSLEADVLAGYGLVLPRLSVLALGGAAMIGSEDDPGIRRTRTGAKAIVSAYATPTDQTMAYARVSYATIANAFELQLKAGVKVFGIGYLGPEAKYAGRVGNDEYRIGPHLSGISLGPFALSVSAGWLSDRQLGSGQYFSTSVYAAF